MQATPKIREAVRTGTGGELSKLKEKVLEEIHRLLVIMMGEPPQKFDWTYCKLLVSYSEMKDLELYHLCKYISLLFLYTAHCDR